MAHPDLDSRRSPRLAGFEATFREETRQLFLERARFLLKTTLVLYPTFWFLDLVMAPEMAGRFLQIRAAVCVLYLISLAAVYSRHARRLAQPLVMASALASAAGISIMSNQLGGYAGNYFAGNMIVLFVIGFFLPWELGAAALLSTLIIATDLAINLAAHPASHEIGREMVGPLFFLTASGVFTWLATLSSRRTRRRALSLRLRLETANEELKELDRAKSRFFANVTHELRTPLTLLLGPLETLLGEAGDPERQRLFQSMITNAHRLLRQVDALLESARLESGRLRLEPVGGEPGDAAVRAGRGRGPARRAPGDRARYRKARRPAGRHVRSGEGGDHRDEPHLERAQVHSHERESDGEIRPCRRGVDGFRGGRHRPGHPGRRVGEDLPPLPPGGRDVIRHGVGAGALAGAGEAAWRRRAGAERARPGIALPRRASPRGAGPIRAPPPAAAP